MKKDRKSTVKKSVFTIIVLLLLVAFVGGTYARFVSTANGNGDVEIAKWAVKVNTLDISDATKDFDLTFEASKNNANVVDGKIAPGSEATAYVEVDLTGTEVSVEFSCELGDTAATNLSTIFGSDYENKVDLAIGTPELGEATSNMTLDTENKVVKVGSEKMNGKVRVPITITWSDDEANNISDTSTGVTKTTVNIPVKLTVKQHIAA